MHCGARQRARSRDMSVYKIVGSMHSSVITGGGRAPRARWENKLHVTVRLREIGLTWVLQVLVALTALTVCFAYPD